MYVYMYVYVCPHITHNAYVIHTKHKCVTYTYASHIEAVVDIKGEAKVY
jgi:hypothetical protein